MKYVVGFDLGGTKMLACLLDEKLQVVDRNKSKVGDTSDSENVFGQIVTCVKSLLKDAKVAHGDVDGIGIAIPGPIDLKTGYVLETPNLGFRQFPLRDRLAKELELPVLLENDVNAGLWGEFDLGIAQGMKHVIGLFPGTGIGGAIIIDGKLYRGATGGAGEIGHMIVQVEGRLCGCGQYGCLESVASKTALAKDGAGLATNGGSPTIAKLAGGDITKMKSSVFGKALKEGEPLVARMVDRAAWFLGIGMANCVNIFNPEAIVLGGGLVDRFGESYVETATKSMHEHAMEFLVKNVKVLTAKLGDDAAAIGAGSLFRLANAA